MTRTQHIVAAVAVALLVASGTGFVAGRATAPQPGAITARVVTKVHFVDRTKVQTNTVKVAGETRTVHTVKTVYLPSGTVAAVTVTDTGVQRESNTRVASSTDKVASTDHTSTIDVTVKPPMMWGAGVLAGWSHAQARPSFVQVQAERALTEHVAVVGFAASNVTGGVGVAVRW